MPTKKKVVKKAPAKKKAVKTKPALDRAGLERYVDQYMEAVQTHEPSPKLFSKRCIFTENGVRLPFGGEGLWYSISGNGTYKFYIPDIETQQIAYIGTAREKGQGKDNTIAIALRLKIAQGLITEAEQLVIRPETSLMGGGSSGGAGSSSSQPAGGGEADKPADSSGTNQGGGASGMPMFPPTGEAVEKMGSPNEIFMREIPVKERPSRNELIKTANYYFSGMQKNDGKGYYPFSDDCIRMENGMQSTNVPLPPGQVMPDPKTAKMYSAHWTCKQQFESGLINFVTRIRDRRYAAVDRERGIVFAFGFFDHIDINWTWQIAELFKIEKGLITRIEAVFHKCPYGMNSGWSTYENGISDKIQIIK